MSTPINKTTSKTGIANRPVQDEVIVTRRAHFNASHRLDNKDRSVRWNRKIFGACNNPNGHGHNYLLEVSVAGRPDPSTGYVIDLRELKEIIRRQITDKCDHCNLNMDVNFLSGIIPSTENLVIAFWNQLAPKITKGCLHCVRLWETEQNRAEYYGPGVPRI